MSSHLSGNDNHYHVADSYYKEFPPRLQATFSDFLHIYELIHEEPLPVFTR